MNKIYFQHNLPQQDTRMLYALIGYGCMYVGESGEGAERFDRTLQERPWTIIFLWVNLLKIDIEDKKSRKHLEAIVIFNIKKLQKETKKEFHLVNHKFTKSLGRFSEEKSSPRLQAKKLTKIIMKVLKSHEDPRGNYISDTAAFKNEAATHETRQAAGKRISRVMMGYERPKKKKLEYIEIIFRKNKN